MTRRILVSVGLVVAPFIAAAAADSAPASAAPPAAFKQCMNGGWQTLTDASGQAFKNQGQCISYQILHPVSLADLVSTVPVSGTASFDYLANGCSFAYQTFDATYPGNASVGNVTLSIAGCADPFTTMSYSGSFTITTSVGALVGSTSGPVDLTIGPGGLVVDFQLTLSVETATGSFAGTTGSLQFVTLYPASAPPTFSGGTVSLL